MLSGHAEVVAAARDPETFSSAASRYLNVPNGMDGEQHRRYRALVDRYLEPEAIAPLEPVFREIAADLVRSVPFERTVDAVDEIGARFAVRAQSAWLGWPTDIEDTLLEWMDANRRATRSRDPDRTREVAERFDAIVRTQVEARLAAGSEAPADVTTSLLGEQIDGRNLTTEEIVSILRNWTAGDLGSIALCVGVVVHRLATDPGLQEKWRQGPGTAGIDAGIDEILRIDDPFTFNKRITTTGVEVGGELIPAGERVLLNWTRANRDPEAIGDPDAFRPRENASRNVVYGIGPHVCPGRALSTLELRVMIEELLAATEGIELDPAREATREQPPYGGFHTVPVRLRR
ncbi:MAG: cytochrome P450 [Solirubrobacterales bacterium]|nr:cytochrome P450 [Solirubrobacterales bacterium]